MLGGDGADKVSHFRLVKWESYRLSCLEQGTFSVVFTATVSGKSSETPLIENCCMVDHKYLSAGTGSL